jgi:hypothetical protein
VPGEPAVDARDGGCQGFGKGAVPEARGVMERFGGGALAAEGAVSHALAIILCGSRCRAR